MFSTNNATPEQVAILSKSLARQNNAAANIQLARLYLNLETVRALILNEILPAAAHLQMPDDELFQTLELTADNIQRHLEDFKLTSGKGR